LVLDEAKLVKGLHLRDEKAFSDAISRYSRLLWAVASRHLSKADGFSAHDIEECIADVFFDLWQNNERYDPLKGSLKSYLCTLTSRKAISRYRKAAQSKIVSFEDMNQAEELSSTEMSSEAPSVDEAIDMDYSDLYGAIAHLPEPTREILIRRYFFEERPATIARKMRLPKKEVENRLYRARKSLSCSLPDRYKEAL
jgi:RNA polymerase sigma-70 factor (ECF subfamily)